MSEPFIGQITMFGGNFAVRNWAFCDGQLLSISQNSALFSILGTTYGGDGRTTFGLPDLRGRIALHQGTGPGLPQYRLGQKGGNHQVALTNPNQLPAHTHAPRGINNAGADETNPAGSSFPVAADDAYYSGSPNTDMAATSSTGASQAFSVQNPYLGINFLIALQGVFPSRN